MFQRYAAALMFTFIVALSGCHSAQQTAADTTRLHKSKLLVQTAGVVVMQAMIAQKNAGVEMPPDYQTKEFVVSVLESIRLQHPNVFMVTDAQERKFAQGKFNNTDNGLAVANAIKKLTESHVALTTINMYLAEEFAADRLSGLRLELAARLLSAQAESALPNDKPAA